MCGLLQLRAWLSAGLRGSRAIQGNRRAPAAVARGARLHGQASYRYRLRRDGNDTDPGDVRRCRAYRHVTAITDVRNIPARRGRDRQRSAQAVAAKHGLCDHAMEKHPVSVRAVSADPVET